MNAMRKARVREGALNASRPRPPMSSRIAPTAESITAFLAKVAAIRRSAMGTEGWLLKHGRAWTAAPLPEGIERGMKTRCYRNAASLAIRRRTLTYVEGYAKQAQMPIPVPHAWCVDAEEAVVDPTWDTPESNLYFGVAFQTPFLRKMLRETRRDGLLDCWELRWPLQRGVLPVRHWKHQAMRGRSPRMHHEL
jgi:hypothetical protein